MNWLSYIYPQTVFRTSSRYNRDIRINEENGKLKLLVNGARESGEYIKGLWVHAFSRFALPEGVKHILVLGIAGGTVIQMFHNRYTRAKIVGVDIDQTMIDIGKRYFGLDTISNLRCICADAKEFVEQTNNRFDVVVIDLFIGPDVPDFVISLPFQRKIRRMLTKNGRVVVNYLRQPGYEEKAIKIEELLGDIYGDVETVDRYNNRFFCAKIG